MRRPPPTARVAALALLALLGAEACAEPPSNASVRAEPAARAGAPPGPEADRGRAEEGASAVPMDHVGAPAENPVEDPARDRDYPLHGLVTAPQIAVRREPRPDAQVLGWLRLGGRVRLKAAPVSTPTCASGWYELHPRGFACSGLGIEVTEALPAPTATEMAADLESALPYRYFQVREPQVPEYHQLPSREAQRAAVEHGQRYAALLNANQTARAERLREGGLPGEPPRPVAVARYLQRNFYVASNGSELRADRRFARTVRGTYVQEAQLIATTGSEFAGVELSEARTLPIAWTVRDAEPLRPVEREDGTVRLRPVPELAAWPRQTIIPWLRRESVEDRLHHVVQAEDGTERYLRHWFVAVAEAIPPPRGVGEDEPWVHVDVGEQTLVAYRGATPVYATLVSSGLDGHDTPRGEFRVRRKFVSDTMANLGPDAGDDSYRIDDVPWTQYFEGSFALHGAFWHHRFGLRRSHGCVNLAPRDARWIYEHTWPAIPEGWHGVSAERGTDFEGSLVVVTD